MGSFEDIIERLSSEREYEFLGRIPTDISYLKHNVRFKAKDYDVFVLVDTDPRFKTIFYMNSEFRDLLIAEKTIPYFE